MEKSLYSLLLSDDVVSEIDRQALRAGLSRSALVNRILAEYASIQTPEMRIDSIFRQMEDLLGDKTLEDVFMEVTEHENAQ